jgi:hypothetical protein
MATTVPGVQAVTKYPPVEEGPQVMAGRGGASRMGSNHPALAVLGEGLSYQAFTPLVLMSLCPVGLTAALACSSARISDIVVQYLSHL